MAEGIIKNPKITTKTLTITTDAYAQFSISKASVDNKTILDIFIDKSTSSWWDYAIFRSTPYSFRVYKVSGGKDVFDWVKNTTITIQCFLY